MDRCDRVVTEQTDGWACELGPDCPLYAFMDGDVDAYVAHHRSARRLSMHELGGEA